MLALHGAQSLSGSKCYWLCILSCCIVTGGIIVGELRYSSCGRIGCSLFDGCLSGGDVEHKRC